MADCRYTPAATDGYLPPDVQLAHLEEVQVRHDAVGGYPGLAVIRAFLVRGNLFFMFGIFYFSFMLNTVDAGTFIINLLF